MYYSFNEFKDAENRERANENKNFQSRPYHYQIIIPDNIALKNNELEIYIYEPQGGGV